MANISFKGVDKVYAGDVKAVDDLHLFIQDKEFIVLVGPSGCGKSTTLRMIAGLEEISAGELHIDDKLVNDLPPKDRDIAMVFQNYALYPHMTVYDNMAFGLKLKKLPKKEIDERVKNAAQILGISEYLNRKPKALSGGQRQRVALGRAIVRKPKVFLMDEPLSNLDAKLRTETRTEILALWKKLDTTFVYVTHDQVEAMTMGTRIVIMNRGVVQQVDTPQNVFEYPKNLFVASFIGSPQMNLFDTVLEKKDDGYYVTFGNQELKVENDESLKKYNFSRKDVVIGIRPAHVIVADEATGYLGQVELTEMLGTESFVHMDYKGQKILANMDTEDVGKKSEVYFTFNMHKVILFDKETELNMML